MRNLLSLLILMSAGLAADKAPKDELAKLDARELHNRGTQRLAEGDLAGAEEALRASLGRDIDPLRPPALHNLGHVRFGKGKTALGGKTAGDVTELSIARSYLEAADADISDMKDQIELLDKAKAEGREPDYVPATSALGGGIGTFRTIKKLIPQEEAMVTKRIGVSPPGLARSAISAAPTSWMRPMRRPRRTPMRLRSFSAPCAVRPTRSRKPLRLSARNSKNSAP